MLFIFVPCLAGAIFIYQFSLWSLAYILLALMMFARPAYVCNPRGTSDPNGGVALPFPPMWVSVVMIFVSFASIGLEVAFHWLPHSYQVQQCTRLSGIAYASVHMHGSQASVCVGWAIAFLAGSLYCRDCASVVLGGVAGA